MPLLCHMMCCQPLIRALTVSAGLGQAGKPDLRAHLLLCNRWLRRSRLSAGGEGPRHTKQPFPPGSRNRGKNRLPKTARLAHVIDTEQSKT